MSVFGKVTAGSIGRIHSSGQVAPRGERGGKTTITNLVSVVCGFWEGVPGWVVREMHSECVSDFHY